MCLEFLSLAVLTRLYIPRSQGCVLLNPSVLEEWVWWFLPVDFVRLFWSSNKLINCGMCSKEQNQGKHWRCFWFGLLYKAYLAPCRLRILQVQRSQALFPGLVLPVCSLMWMLVLAIPSLDTLGICWWWPHNARQDPGCHKPTWEDKAKVKLDETETLMLLLCLLGGLSGSDGSPSVLVDQATYWSFHWA